ncbi:hypothetical protein [Rhodanobacter soli]|jgi:hypothetical protein|uniref:Integral membrane protein n=1 Tax=Rhodanobacter soli TaxID=590609 RepID=A0ABV2PWS7_9GAMM
MERNSPASSLRTVIITLLVWLSIWPVIGSTLSFLGAIPTRWPALVYFANSAMQWRVVFLLAGCVALGSAWLVHKRRMVPALATAVVFAALYIPTFPIVWAQRTIAMGVAAVPALLIGYSLIKSRRREA